MYVRNRKRLLIALGGIALSIIGIYLLTELISDSLAIVAAIAWATLIIVGSMYRWRATPSMYDSQFRELHILIDLQPLVGGSFLPFGAWALAPDDLHRLVSTIQHERFETIVECGTGVSTIAIGRLLRQLGRGHLYSLEEDRSWHDVMAATLVFERLTDHVTLIHAPLEHYREANARWYASEGVDTIRSSIQHIDLLLIDGPKSESMYSRYPALPIFLPLLDTQSLIVLDDTRRTNEMAVLDRWRKENDVFVNEVTESRRGQSYIRLSR